jgi:cell division transport system permease protein
MLIVMSAFFIFSLNARSIMKKVGQQPPIEVYMQLNCPEETLAATREYIGMNPRIIEVIERSPLENYEYFKSNLGSSSSVLDSFDYDMYLPYTFNVRIEDPQYADEVSNYLQTLPGVSKVAKESRVMSVLTKATSFVNIATVASFIVLFIIALFIISNMVRISVYSRAYEIEIMKFVGATNMYIRVPFIIEGAIVGLISAGCAWVLSIIAYRSLFIKLMVGIDWSSYYALLPYKSLMWMVLALCVLMGVLIGAVGSGIAVRKYVKV